MTDDQIAGLRVPPHSTEAEQAVLGAILIDNAAFDGVGDVLRPEHFYRHEHRVIWEHICALIAACKAADIITVAAEGGDLKYLNALAQSVASSRHARGYADIVIDRWRRRQLIGVGDELAAQAWRAEAGAPPVPELCDAAVVRLLALQGGAGAEREPRRLDQLLVPFIDALQARASGETDAIATGLHDVDRLLSGGPRRGELVVIGARPSMGKSALSLTLARNMARAGPVLVCSMEDSEFMLVARQVAAAGRVNLADIRAPDRAPDRMWTGVTEGVEQLGALRLFIDDQPSLTLMDVRRKMAQVRRREGDLRVVVVDYLQLMQGPGDNRHQVLGAIAAGLKSAAKEFNTVVVLLSQLTREADKTSGPPRLDHLRESGGIEEAADIVGLLWREHRSKPKLDNKHLAQVEFAKHKNGPTDTVKLWFDGATQRFCDWEGGHVDA